MARFLTRRGILVQLAASGFIAACTGTDKGGGYSSLGGATGSAGDEDTGGDGSGGGVGGETGGDSGGSTGDTDDTGAGTDDTGGADDTGEVEADPCEVAPADDGDLDEVTSFAGEGPNYRSGQPETGNLNMREEEGVKLWVVGQVFNRDKEPMEGARVDAWQVDQEASYNLLADDFHGHGYQYTDANGAYCFETLRPPPIYSMEGTLNNVAHVHLKVWVDGEVIQTYQIYFSDDPALEENTDWLPEDLIKDVEHIGDNEQRVRLDIVLDLPVPPG